MGLQEERFASSRSSRKSHDIADAGSAVPYISFRFIVLLTLFTVLIFSNTINRYFLFDDFEHLYSIRYNSLPEVLIGQDTNLETKFFRPIPMFFFWVQYKLFGPSPAVFHLTTIFLHMLCALLGSILFYLFSKNARCSMIFAFVFVAFPNHAETTNWPAINFVLWATLFYLGSLVFFGLLRLTSRLHFLWLSLACSCAAILSNEAAFTLPVAVIAFDLLFSKSRRISLPVSRRLLEYSAYFGVLLIVLVSVRKFLWTGIGYPSVGGENIISFYLNNLDVLAFDMTKIIFNAWKNLITPIPPEMPYASQITLIIWAMLIAALALLLRKRRLNLVTLVYCLVFTSVAILPLLGTYRYFKITRWIRHLYLPSVGSSYIVAMMIDGMLAGIDRPAVRRALLVGSVFPLVVLTKYYDSEWIRAQEENRDAVQATVDYLAPLPRYSRVYVSGTPWTKKDVPGIDSAFSSAVGIYLDTKYRQAYMDFHPGDRPLALDREVYDEQEWRYVWLNWNEETGALDAERPIEPQRPTGTRSLVLDFDDWATSQRLEVANDMARVYSPDFPYPLYEVRGEWGLLKMPRFQANTPVKYLIIDMMIKSEGSRRDISRLFWATRHDPSYTGRKSISFFTETDGKFHTYRIPLYKSGLSLIDPEIIRFGIRPSQKPGTVFSVKRLKIEYY